MVCGAQQPGTESPVIQIWRESPSQCGTYFKPTNSDDYQIHFTSGGPINCVFQHQLVSNTSLSSRATEVQEQPRIVMDTATTGISSLYHKLYYLNLFF